MRNVSNDPSRQKRSPIPVKRKHLLFPCINGVEDVPDKVRWYIYRIPLFHSLSQWACKDLQVP